MRPTLLWGVVGRDPVALAALRAAAPAQPSFRRAAPIPKPAVQVVMVPETLGTHLKSAIAGGWRRRIHLRNMLHRAINVVFAHIVLRAPVLGLLGYAIGLTLTGIVGPYAIWSGGKVMMTVSPAAIGAAVGVAAGLWPSMVLLGLVTGSLELAWVVLIVWFGLVTAFVTLAGRLANAFNALQF